MPRWNNWSGRLEDHPKAVRFIRTEEDAAASVIAARDGQRSLRVAGAGHSHAPLVIGADEILDISAMAGVLSVDESRKQVWVGAGTPIYMLGPVLTHEFIVCGHSASLDRRRR
jgi:FAD/FMN-containing dehydrogenase